MGWLHVDTVSLPPILANYLIVVLPRQQGRVLFWDVTVTQSEFIFEAELVRKMHHEVVTFSYRDTRIGRNG